MSQHLVCCANIPQSVVLQHEACQHNTLISLLIRSKYGFFLAISLWFIKAHDLDKSEQNLPLRLMEDPNIELLGSWGRPITLYWLPAPGIPVNTN